MEILEYRKNDDPVKRGYFDILIPEWQDMILENLCYCEKNGKSWINLPSRKKGDNWSPYFHFKDQKMTERLKQKARDKIREYLKHQ